MKLQRSPRMAQDFLLLAPVQIVRQVAHVLLLVVEHLAADVANVHDVAIRIDGDVGLRLLALVADDAEVVVGLVRAGVLVVAHLDLVPELRLVGEPRVAGLDAGRPVCHGSELSRATHELTALEVGSLVVLPSLHEGLGRTEQEPLEESHDVLVSREGCL